MTRGSRVKDRKTPETVLAYRSSVLDQVFCFRLISRDTLAISIIRRSNSFWYSPGVMS
jgi:hypothetical protein